MPKVDTWLFPSLSQNEDHEIILIANNQIMEDFTDQAE